MHSIIEVERIRRRSNRQEQDKDVLFNEDDDGQGEICLDDECVCARNQGGDI